MNFLRRIALTVLKRTAFDITIRHHLTEKKFVLNTYHHKGYWFFGKEREGNSIKIFQSWIKRGDYVLEIGGHIGYFTTFYAEIVGDKGKVDVFEPSMANRNYLLKNIGLLDKAIGGNIKVVEKGAGDVDGELNFYIDPITGQNNSFVENFEGFYTNRTNSVEKDAILINERVEVVRLDTYFAEQEIMPDFVKIDVEGFEWNVIEGFKEVIEAAKPDFMIEIQADSEEIINYFKIMGYDIYNDSLASIKCHEDYLKYKTPNIFFKYKKIDE